MATYNKFNQFTTDLDKGVHKLDVDSLKIMLSNTTPSASNAVKADITEISSGHGYTAGGLALTQTLTKSSGTSNLDFADVSVTASGGNIGPFQYLIVYNDTPTSPAGPLIAWIDILSPATCFSGQELTIVFDALGFFDLT